MYPFTQSDWCPDCKKVIFGTQRYIEAVLCCAQYRDGGGVLLGISADKRPLSESDIQLNGVHLHS